MQLFVQPDEIQIHQTAEGAPMRRHGHWQYSVERGKGYMCSGCLDITPPTRPLKTAKNEDNISLTKHNDLPLCCSLRKMAKFLAAGKSIPKSESESKSQTLPPET